MDYSDSNDGNDGRLSATGDQATMAVVTLILEIDGDHTKLPKIRSIQDVEDALTKIAADAKVSDCLQVRIHLIQLFHTPGHWWLHR